MSTNNKSRSAFIYLLGDSAWAERSAAELATHGHRVNQVADYKVLSEEASREWSDYIIGRAATDSELRDWERFAHAFSKMRDRSGCDSKLCLVVPEVRSEVVAVAKQTQSELIAEEFGLSAANHVQFHEHHRVLARFSKPLLIIRHACRGRRSIVCDEKERLRSARIGDGRYEGTPDFTGEELVVADVFVRFGPVLGLDDVADVMNTDPFYTKQLGRKIAPRALPMKISRLNKEAAITLHRQRGFQIIGAARGRTGHRQLLADWRIDHFRVD